MLTVLLVGVSWLHAAKALSGAYALIGERRSMRGDVFRMAIFFNG
jgi:hypothetical protein